MKTQITVLFCSILFTFSYECVAQPTNWEIILQEDFIFHINNDSKGNIYAACFNYNNDVTYALKSTDNGINWDTVFNSPTSFYLPTIYIDTNYAPNDRIILDSEIDYLSTDYGESWEELNAPPNLQGHRYTSFGDILGWRRYADYNIYRSTDNGISWDTLMVLPPIGNNERLSDLEVDILDNIYLDIRFTGPAPAYRSHDNIYKSTDGGNTWSLFYDSGYDYIGSTKVYCTVAGDIIIRDPNSHHSIHYLLSGNIHTYDLLVVSPWQKTNDHLYLFDGFYTSGAKVLFSPDSGNSFQDITSGLLAGSLLHSSLCNDALGYLYINKDGIYKTTFTTERIFNKTTIDFGVVKLYDTTHIQVTLNNPFDFDTQIDSIVCYNDQFFISDLQTNIIPAEDSITATIAYNPTELDTSETFIYLYSALVDARIRAIGIGQNPSSIENHQNIISEFSLSQNYPNPFNPTTTISYQIPEKGFVTLKVYDVLGNEVATLVNEESATGGAGSYEVEFNATGLPSGIYFYQLRTGEFIETKKMILLK